MAQDATELDTEELRLRRIQEKNRRNQRKFRARQRVSLPTNPLTLLRPRRHGLGSPCQSRVVILRPSDPSRGTASNLRCDCLEI